MTILPATVVAGIPGRINIAGAPTAPTRIAAIVRDAIGTVAPGKGRNPGIAAPPAIPSPVARGAAR